MRLFVTDVYPPHWGMRRISPVELSARSVLTTTAAGACSESEPKKTPDPILHAENHGNVRTHQLDSTQREAMDVVSSASSVPPRP